jgi:predicted ATPase/DNA-binding SARP family transcriptional activator
MPMLPPAVARKDRVDRGEQIVIGSGTGFDDGETSSRVRNEHVEQAVPSYEIGALSSQIDDLCPRSGPHRERHRLHSPYSADPFTVGWDDGPVRIALLGPLLVVVDDRDVPVSGGRLRVLLTQLALAAPQAVSPGALAESLWRDDPPADVANALQSLVSRLRRTLGDPAAIRQSPAGYALAVNRDDVDVHVFAQLARSAHAELAADRPDRARAVARDALALWRGHPPDEIGAQLGELCLQVRGDLLDARLRLGDAAGVVGELEALVTEFPLRERYVELLMRALVADARPAEALAGFERLRQVLGDELGTDPSAPLQELHLAVLRGEVAPPPPAVGRDPLPSSLTSFVGREDQQKRIAELLTSSRLVTLVGPGGAGKTRLAIECGRSLRESGPARDGIWLAELAPVVNPDDVAQAVYDGIGVRETALLERAGQSARDVIDRLVEVLSDRSAVLIVDNCEHVLEAAAQVTTTLLARCPRLRIITTSREPLGVLGETLVPVPPLEQPTDDSLDPADYPAMRLFADRAAAVALDFALTPDVLAPVAEIVRRLDGLPLAIELAAARMRSMPVEQIADRLSDRFRLLAGGNRAAVPRHRTLRAVVEWSWELLEPEERTLVESLAVFSGGISVPAAQAVYRGDDVEGKLASLVDKSLLQLLTSRGEPRYRMLETIREYGLDQLAARGEVADVRAAHAGYFADLVATAEPMIRSADQLPWMARLETEQADILGAVKFRAEAGEAQAALEMVVGLAWYWMILGRHNEVATWTKVALDAAGERTEDMSLLAGAFHAINAAAWVAGSDDESFADARDMKSIQQRLTALGPSRHPMLVMLRPVLAMFVGFTSGQPIDASGFEEAIASPDPWVAAAIRSFRAAFAENEGDVQGMREDATIALAEFRRLGERWGQANTLQVLAQVDVMQGRLADAQAGFGEALRLTAELGSTDDQVFLRVRLVDVLMRQGREDEARDQMQLIEQDVHGRPAASFESMFIGILRADLALTDGRLEDARRLQRECLARLDQMPEVSPRRGHGVAISLAVAAKIDLVLGEIEAARDHLRDAYRYGVGTHDMPILATVGTAIARLAAEIGRPADAAEILGASAQLRGSDDATNLDIVALVERLRRALPDFAERYAWGRARSREDAIARLDPAHLD